MQKDLVFFKKEGEEGVALTSTSANHIANMAKEYIQGMETQLNNVSFLNVEVGLISANAHNVIQEGTSSEYREALKAIMLSFKTWKDAKSQEYSKLKIAVPNSLLGVYNTVNSLGK